MTVACSRLLVALGLLLGAFQDPVADEAATARLRAALDATGLRYEVSSSGKSFVVRFGHENGRQQTVYVAAKPSKVAGLLVHSVYTTVWARKGQVPDDALVERLVRSSRKIGTFYVFDGGSTDSAIRFGAKFDATDLGAEPKPEDPLVQRLRRYVEFVDAVGEEVDVEVNGDGDVR